MDELQRLFGVAVGNWVEAAGSTTKAIGETEELFQETLRSKLLRISGDAGQGIGNAIIALLEEDPFVALGNWIQVAGTSSNSVAATLELIDHENIDFDPIKVEIIGDILQALGSQITAEALREDATLGELVRALGNELQTWGAILEAIGGVYMLRDQDERGQRLQVIGAWGQAVGGTIQAIGATRDYIRATESTLEKLHSQ